MTVIVVGIDGSDSAERALVWALGYAELSGASIRVIHVWTPDADSMVRPLTGLPYDGEAELQAVATGWLNDALGDRPTNVPYSLDILKGAPGPLLVAAGTDADLIVVGTGVHTGLRRLLIGSVSHHVLSHAPCPVVAVPPKDQTGGSVIP